MQSLPYPTYRLKEIFKEGQVLGWQEIKQLHKEHLKYLIENAILSELELFVGCGKYERGNGRKCYRNGYYERLVATTLGEMPIKYPRLRYESFQSRFIEKYSRRTKEIDYAILTCFVLGGSVRKTKKICDLFSDVQISPSTVSNILGELDTKAREFHSKKIDRKYRFLILDGLWIKVQDKYEKKKVVLFAMGITYDGKKEVIGFMLADAEKEEEYSTFINRLISNGLDLECLELVIHDGAKGLEAALNVCLPFTQRQYCIFHKIQNISQKLNSPYNRKSITNDAGNIYEKAQSKREAIRLLEQFIGKWRYREPRAARCFAKGFDKTLVYFDFPNSVRHMIRTSNYLERYLREIRRRTKPMGNFKNNKSVNRIVYALTFTLNDGVVPFEFTQHS